MLVCAFLHIFARETAGAARTWLSLRPLFEEGGKKQQNPGETRRGNYMRVQEIVIASAAKQSISPRKERTDRLAALAMTGAYTCTGAKSFRHHDKLFSETAAKTSRSSGQRRRSQSSNGQASLLP
jgi:hypothetical protein